MIEGVRLRGREMVKERVKVARERRTDVKCKEGKEEHSYCLEEKKVEKDSLIE